MSQLNSVFRRQQENVTGNKTLDAGDNGVVQNVTATATVTLPAMTAGYQYVIRVGADNITVNVSPAAADQLIGNGFTAADNKDAICTNGRIGDEIHLVGDGANGYVFSRVQGTWTREA